MSSPPAVFFFLDRDYRYKWIVIQIPHNAELVPILFSGRKFLPNRDSKMRLERRLGYETEERRLYAHACRLRPQRTSLVWSGQPLIQISHDCCTSDKNNLIHKPIIHGKLNIRFLICMVPLTFTYFIICLLSKANLVIWLKSILFTCCNNSKFPISISVIISK